MRLYDTFTRGLVELPPPPGPIRMYFCGPTVYQRIHVGNALAVPCSPSGSHAGSGRRGYETKLVVNITDINDKIYDAAPGASARLAADASRWYVEDTDRLGLGRPDVEPTAVETVGDQIAMIEELVGRGFAYESDGDVYFRVARYPEYGRLSGQRPDQVEEQEPNPRKEDPRDFALWKAKKPGEDTSWESPWGSGRPGWHIECSAMSEKHLGPEFEIHGGGLDLVFPHHENEIAQSRALGHPFAQLWMHNGMLTLRGREDAQVASATTSRSRTRSTDWGRGDAARVLPDRALAEAARYSEKTLGPRLLVQSGFARCFRNARSRDRAGRRLGAASRTHWTTTSTRRRPSQCCTSGADHDLLRRALALFGLESLAARVEAPAEVVELAERRRLAARAAATSTRPTGSATSSRRAAGRRATRPAATGSSPEVTRELVYGRNAVRELYRGPREALELWVDGARRRADPWLESGPRAAGQAGAGADGGDRHAGPPGCRRLVRAVPLCGRVLARRRARTRCSSASTRSPTRGTSARCRAAPGRARPGSSLPAHGAARVTAAVCRSSAGRSSTCRWRSCRTWRAGSAR